MYLYSPRLPNVEVSERVSERNMTRFELKHQFLSKEFWSTNLSPTAGVFFEYCVYFLIIGNLMPANDRKTDARS